MEYDLQQELFDFWVYMERAHYQMKRIRERKLGEIGLSIAKMKILNYIYQMESRNLQATPTKLARLLLKAPSTVTERLNRIEAQGLITRTGDSENKNVVILNLTELGNQLVAKAREMRTLSKIISKLNHRKRLSVMDAFRVLLSNARKLNDLEL